ncbi:MAG: binding-protein-dependent transport system inner rane component [Firmicutes bacterium]|nr:binding-protein-dependent transport system inner rane component [Bacillota bacterium]
MLTYLVRRVALMIPILLLVSILAFSLIHLVPGDPATVILGPEAPRETVERMRKDLGLDRPLPVQYAAWLSAAVRGNLGRSLVDRQPVAGLIIQRLPATLELAFLTFLFAMLVAVPVGVYTAARRGGAADMAGSVLALAGQSIPSFWLGIMLMMLFALKLKWLPTSGYVPFWQSPKQNLMVMILPALATGAREAAVISRYTRASLLEVLRADFVRTARAKGVAEWIVVMRHALRNALIPVITASGLQVAALIGGLVITETIFTIPGFGRLIVDAIFQRDIPVIQGCVLFAAFMVMAVNLAVDLIYSLVDPRITLAGERG